MGHIALIDKETNRVENVIVPPEGTNAWFYDDNKYIAVKSETAAIGNIYEQTTGQFLPDPTIAEADAKRQAEMTEEEKIKEALESKRVKIQAAIDSLKSNQSLTIEQEGTLAALENSLENVIMKLNI